MACEVEPSTCKPPVTDWQSQMITSEIGGNNPKLKELSQKHTKDGIMRRNGLLLEHILHERLNRSIET